jgi:isocitrate dehydrogenase (NAD+)
MLDHIGEITAARRVEDALHDVYREGKTLTRDVGGTATTTEFSDAVTRALKVEVKPRHTTPSASKDSSWLR